MYLICTETEKDKTGIQGSQARVQQPRVLNPSQRFNIYRNTEK